MVNLLIKIWDNKWILRSILSTIYFNFRCLPFKQAIKLPIILYKPRFGSLKGAIHIPGGGKTGMIKLGYFDVGIYQNNGIYFSNEGEIFFNGRTEIGNDSYIGVGPQSRVSFGKNFIATTTFRLTSFAGVTFGEYVRFGWDCIVMDSDFHRLKSIDGKTSKGYGKITIGSYNWIGNGCRIMKKSVTPDYCTISAGTWISGKIEVDPYSVIGNKRDVQVLKSGLYLDPLDNNITDYTF